MAILFFFILGLVVGSFLNVCISRLPNDKSIIFPPSSCPKCNHKLSAIDLIPIVSYFILGGKCRYCGAKISFRYPAVEFLAGILYAFSFYKNGMSLNFFFGALFISLMIIVFFSDLETQIIPDSLNIIGVVFGMIFYALRRDVFSSILGITLGILIMSLIYLIGLFLYKKEALGMGDIKLAAMMGAFLGTEKLLYSIFLSYIIGAAVALTLLILRIKKKEDLIPFGPFMALAAVVIYLY